MDDTEGQPGYHYASLNMKAKPLNLLPKLEELSQYITDIHCVPPNPTQENQDHAERIAIVFRTGDERLFLKDLGRVCTDLSPRVKKKFNFRHGKKMQEGTMSTLRQLNDMEAHLG
jgi:hypothetical protein